jgi:hypothetical protein
LVRVASPRIGLLGMDSIGISSPPGSGSGQSSIPQQRTAVGGSCDPARPCIPPVNGCLRHSSGGTARAGGGNCIRGRIILPD